MRLQSGLSFEKKLEVLKTGEELGRKILGEDSTNAPTRRFLKRDENTNMVAYGKERFQEAAFKVEDAQMVGVGGEIINYVAVKQQRYNKETNEFYWEEIDPYSLLPSGWEEDQEQAKRDVDGYVANFKNLTSPELGESVRELIAKKLGTSPDEVDYSNEEINARIGVLPGEMMVREWAMSRIDMLLKFGLVPLTVIRPEKDGHDVASVQEGVVSTDGRFPAREWLEDEGIEFFQTDPAKWSEIIDRQTLDAEGKPRFEVVNNEPAQSLMRAAVLAYLTGEMDGIMRNHIIDPVTKKLSKIDSGLSQGVATGEWLKLGYQIQDPATGEMVDAYHIEKIRSMPLEIALKQGLELDQDARDYMTELYKELRRPDSKQRRYLLSVMEIVFKRYGKRMAEQKLEEFLYKMSDIVLNGRPTQLDKDVHYSIEIEERLEREKRRRAQKKNQASK